MLLSLSFARHSHIRAVYNSSIFSFFCTFSFRSFLMNLLSTLCGVCILISRPINSMMNFCALFLPHVLPQIASSFLFRIQFLFYSVLQYKKDSNAYHHAERSFVRGSAIFFSLYFILFGSFADLLIHFSFFEWYNFTLYGKKTLR